MFTPSIDFRNLVRQLTPPLWRHPARLAFLAAMAEPLRVLFADFHKWRSNTRMVARVNAQVAVLEGYLRKKYDATVDIKIVSYDDGAMEICLRSEGDTLSLMVALESEVAPSIDLPLSGEVRHLFGDANFIVYIPSSVDFEAVRADIERFRTAGTIYRIMAEYHITDELSRRIVSDTGQYLTITKLI